MTQFKKSRTQQIPNSVNGYRKGTKKNGTNPGILSISNSTPSLANTKSSLVKGTGIPFGKRLGLRAMED